VPTDARQASGPRVRRLARCARQTSWTAGAAAGGAEPSWTAGAGGAERGAETVVAVGSPNPLPPDARRAERNKVREVRSHAAFAPL